jgi:hypothetical protein
MLELLHPRHVFIMFRSNNVYKCFYHSTTAGASVTRKGVAEQGFYGCVFCVNARFTDQGSRVNPAVSFINESGGFYHFWKEVSASCAWNAWEVLLSGCVGWEVQEEGGANDGGGWRRIDELLRK